MICFCVMAMSMECLQICIFIFSTLVNRDYVIDFYQVTFIEVEVTVFAFSFLLFQ